MECFLCGGGGHAMAKCPSLERLRGVVRNATVAQTGKGGHGGGNGTPRRDPRLGNKDNRTSKTGTGRWQGATERSQTASTPQGETRTTERPRRVQDAGREATERSQAASTPQGELKERRKTVDETVSSERSKGALESTPEDAAGTRVNQFSVIIGEVSTGRVEPVAQNAEDDEDSTKGMDSTEQYDRLFTDTELDMLERRDSPGVQKEPEEYDKELEERLIPVDEDKILQRAKRSAKEQEEPTLADMSAVLGIPEEVLERTKEVSSGDMRTPEYWLDWYANALETSTESKRANRDFREVEESEGTSLPVVSAVSDDKDERTGNGVPTGDEEGQEFMRNVCVGLDGTAASVSWNPEKGAATKGPHRGGPAALESDETEDDIPPLRDKEDGDCLDEELLRGYLVEVGGTRNVAFLDRAVNWALCYFEGEARGIRDKLCERARDYPEIVDPGAATVAAKKQRKVTFWLPIKGGAAAVDEEAPEVYWVSTGRAPEKPRRPGLREVDAEDGQEGDDDVVPQGKRVICSVGGMQALSDGYIDCCPSEMLADTGAIASLVDRRVLRRLGRDSEPLKPYNGTLDSVSGHAIRVRGVIDLPVTLGTLEKTLPFVVTDHLFVDAILGTDSLKAFRAVIDLEEQSMTLKGTGNVIPLGVARVEETYAATISSSVRLEPGRQALLRSRVRGAVRDKSVVLVEGAPGMDDSLRVTRTLCTVTDGTVLVEVYNASAEEVEVRSGAYLAAVTVVPESAFAAEAPEREGTLMNIGAVLSAFSGNAETQAEMTAAMKNRDDDDFEVDFQDSSLGAEQRRLFVGMLKDMRDLFVETSKKPESTELLRFSIDTGTHAPIKQPPYQVSKTEGDVMESEIQEYLDLGPIRPSTSPWVSPVPMIRKPDGGIRFCIDYRKLNSVTVKDSYPMPLIDDILDVLGNAKLFSTMDIASGYWNVPMDPGSVEKTAFTSKFGIYEWLVMPFGLCNEVPAFERLMENVLADLKWRVCLVYLDDCVVFSDDFPTHLVRVRQVLERFNEAGFKLKMKKCHWGRDQVAFLGHIVTPTGIMPNPEKAKAVMNIERPHAYTRGVSDARGRQARSSHRVCKQDVGGLPAELDFQDERTTEIECWGIVWATRKFRCYLDHAEFDLFTDHQALTWVFDSLSRLYNRPDVGRVGAIRMADPLNDVPEDGADLGTPSPGVTRTLEGTPDPGGTTIRNAEEGVVQVGEHLETAVPGDGTLWSGPLERDEPLTQAEQEEDLQSGAPLVHPSPVNVFGLDCDKFVEEQERVPWMRALKAFLRDGALTLDPQVRVSVLKMSPHYVMRNGVLMRIVHLGARADPARTICVPAVPLPFIETVLHYCHADIFSAHLGKTKTANKALESGLMQRMPVQDLSGPFALLVVDAITPRGNKYILVFVDYLTRWVEAFAVASLDTISFVNTMIEGVICRHGVLERLLSDKGSNFTSNLARSLYETLGIKKLYGAAYHPQTQGLVERFNGTLMGMLRMFVNETQTDWDVYLPRVLFAYRTAYHEGLGDTPFFSLYGRDPMLPIDLAFLNTGKEWKSNEVAVYRRKLYHSLKDSRRLVERQLLKAKDRHEKRLDKQVKVSYAGGEAVWVYQYFRARVGECRTKKLAFSRHGPYCVVGQVGENAYKIAIPAHPNKIMTVNVNRLKRFKGRWSRPYADEVPSDVGGDESDEGTGPLEMNDLPPTSFVERLSIGGEETAFSGVSSPIVDIVAKKVEKRELQYLVLTATYETFWLSRTALAPEFGTLIRAFEDADRKKRCLPELRRNARLVDANADVDDAEMMF
ncbi:hypothetical protein F441_22269 [Phytophthora nicotianae CJ01A1]|uniref:RNA-directed DNA polymerase n=1 Tax=Phytophthora nicotianae CJ01A1 TaxID=1317063 RepID=W2VPZ0_PHYNI|nr:hypothetical protein F441_22269 [Phytophthora nicotianae CJ01A1]